MVVSKTLLMVAASLPATLSFANVLAAIHGLNNQNPQAMYVGTLMKNFLNYEGVRMHTHMGNLGYAQKIQGSSRGGSSKHGLSSAWNLHHPLGYHSHSLPMWCE